MKPSDFLRSLAQNDYMIDQHTLPDGKNLEHVADWLDEMLVALEESQKRADDLGATLGVAVHPAWQGVLDMIDKYKELQLLP